MCRMKKTIVDWPPISSISTPSLPLNSQLHLRNFIFTQPRRFLALNLGQIHHLRQGVHPPLHQRRSRKKTCLWIPNNTIKRHESQDSHRNSTAAGIANPLEWGLCQNATFPDGGDSRCRIGHTAHDRCHAQNCYWPWNRPGQHGHHHHRKIGCC